MAVEVSLLDMLDARERRVHHQQELLERYHKPLICFTMNIAGPIKDSPLIRRGFARGQQLLRQQFSGQSCLPCTRMPIVKLRAVKRFMFWTQTR